MPKFKGNKQEIVDLGLHDELEPEQYKWRVIGDSMWWIGNCMSVGKKYNGIKVSEDDLKLYASFEGTNSFGLYKEPHYYRFLNWTKMRRNKYR
jgi:hypothetical protein